MIDLTSRIRCHDRYRRELSSSEHITDCMPPCKSSRYIKSTSFNSWPIRSAAPTLWELVQKARNKTVNSGQQTSIDKKFHEPFSWNLSLKLIQETLLKLEIFAQSPKGDLIEEKMTYSIAKLFSDFGGNLGLWIGVSVLTVAEVLELIVGAFMAVTYAMSFAREDEKREKMFPRRRGTPSRWQNEMDLQGESFKSIL